MSFGFGATPVAAPAAFGRQTTPTAFNLGGTVAPNTVAPQFASPFGKLGATPAPSTGQNFNSPTLNLATPAGQQSTAAPSPFGAATATPAPGFALGQQAAPQASSLFASNVATQGTLGGFFSTPTTVAAAAGGALSLGAPTSTVTSTPNFAFGVPASSATSTTATGLSMGGITNAGTTAIAATSQPSFSFAPSLPGRGFTGPTPTTAPPPKINFGAFQQASLSGVSLGTATATTTPASLSFGLGGLGGLKTTAAPGFGATTTAAATTTTAPPSLGLGGTATIETKPATGPETNVQDQPLPNELLQTVEHFKTFLKEQKDYSAEIARFSTKDLAKVEQDIVALQTVLNEMEAQLEKNRLVAHKLKMDTCQALQHVELAQRTVDTPAALQQDNTAPFLVFADLANRFESDLHTLKVQVENVDKIVGNRNVPTLDPQDLSMAMRHLHDTFVALAGRLHSVHAQVEQQKRQYLDLRKHVLHDTTNVFDAPDANALDSITSVYQPRKTKVGPTPFTSFGMSQVQVMAEIPTTTPTLTTNFGVPPTGNSLFSPSAFSFNSPNSSGFQLQKPPTGSKRGLQR